MPKPAYRFKFSEMHRCPTALGYWNVDLLTRYSEALPEQVDLKTMITRRVDANIPIISAAMDDICSSSMLINLGMLGAIGTADKGKEGASPDRQIEIVRQTKRFKQGCINNPLVLAPYSLVDDAIAIWDKFRYKAIPITEDGTVHGKLVGMLKEDPYVLSQHRGKKVSERMKEPDDLLVRSHNISPKEAEAIIIESGRNELLTVDEQGNLLGMYKLADIRLSSEYPHACKDGKGRLRVAAAIGGPGKDLDERLKRLAEAEVDIFCIDTSQGWSRGVGDLTLPVVKRDYPDIDVIAGNVDGGEGAEFLIQKGADAVKVGIGPSPICRTKRNIGGGMPQLTAVYEAACVARNHGIPVIADGGIYEVAGDFVKAFAAGASAVMIGSLLAATEETPGEPFTIHGKSGWFKRYRGMGSKSAQREGSASRYCQEGKSPDELVSHGVEMAIPCKGPVQKEIIKMTDTLRDAMSKYYGCRTIKELNDADLGFVLVNRSPPEEFPDAVIQKEE
jgi:IMP dehydrogenase